jgi:hypothetical protein
VEGKPDRLVLALNPEKQEVDRRWREQLLERAWEALDGLLERWESGRLKDEQAAIATTASVEAYRQLVSVERAVP